MAEYAFTPDVVRVTLVVGVVLSMILYERVQLTTGGAIVPSYLAMAVYRPAAVAVTLAVGYATYLIVHRWIGRTVILYGRRRFEVEVLVGLALILCTTLIAARAGQLDPMWYGLAGIGFLVPGILAHDMGRQRPGRTVAVTLATAGLLVIFMRAYSAVVGILPGAKGTDVVGLASVLGYPRELLVIAVASSVLMGMFVYARLGLRSGGFITGAYLALVSPRWWDLAFTVGVAVVVFLVVVRVLMPRMLIFGRRKLATMILVSGLVAWSAEAALIGWSNGDYVPWRGLTIATLMVPALLANDAQRQGWERTLWGTCLTSVGVFTLVSFVAAAATAVGWLS